MIVSIVCYFTTLVNKKNIICCGVKYGDCQTGSLKGCVMSFKTLVLMNIICKRRDKPAVYVLYRVNYL